MRFPQMKNILLHATSISIKNKGVLILGKPGTGKSSLALQLMDRKAQLVSDDQTVVTCEENQLILSPPLPLKGLLEVRGIGICTFPFQEKAQLSLSVEISQEVPLERLPEQAFIEYHGIQVPLLRLLKNDPIGAIKVEIMMNQCLTY